MLGFNCFFLPLYLPKFLFPKFQNRRQAAALSPIPTFVDLWILTPSSFLQVMWLQLTSNFIDELCFQLSVIKWFSVLGLFFLIIMIYYAIVFFCFHLSGHAIILSMYIVFKVKTHFNEGMHHESHDFILDFAPLFHRITGEPISITTHSPTYLWRNSMVIIMGKSRPAGLKQFGLHWYCFLKKYPQRFQFLSIAFIKS